jgi:hypothetical protein
MKDTLAILSRAAEMSVQSIPLFADDAEGCEFL